ncbi:hypothetical protein ACFT8W_19830 [Streptomyces hygroscopicus]
MDSYAFVPLGSQHSTFDRVDGALGDISGDDDDDGRSGAAVPA